MERKCLYIKIRNAIGNLSKNNVEQLKGYIGQSKKFPNEHMKSGTI
jgi:hypothetical protein